MQLTCSPVYSISLFTFNFSKPLTEPAYTWTTPEHIGLKNRPRVNVFLNDIFFFVNQAVIYNYADDNILSFIHANIEVLKKVLEQESCILIDWFFKKSF